tara:strand:+ start:225 stop:548 length:324 start_codon:yes stop_codon:yes gene_type:complete
MKILDPKTEEQLERLEAEILKTITNLFRISQLIQPLQDELMTTRALLRNLIYAYRSNKTDAEMDDLLFAVIRDNALSYEDIQIVFDLNDSLFKESIKRMKERDRYEP